jgi:hypothetical protein
MMRIDKQMVALILGIVTTVVGGGEMRLAVARLETRVELLARDVSALQRELAPRVAHMSRHDLDEELDAGAP